MGWLGLVGFQEPIFDAILAAVLETFFDVLFLLELLHSSWFKLVEDACFNTVGCNTFQFFFDRNLPKKEWLWMALGKNVNLLNIPLRA